MLTSSSLKGHTPGGTTPIRITRPTVFRGAAIDAGVIVADATSAEASLLIGCGKAVRYTPPPAPAAAPATTTITVAEDTGSGFERQVEIETAALDPVTETASLPHAPKRRRVKAIGDKL